MKRYALVIASLFLVAAGPVLPTQGEQNRLSEQYTRCLHAQAERLDDGSKNMDMADTIVAACKPQFKQMVEQLIAESRNLTDADAQKLKESASEMQRGSAAIEIERVRLERAGKPVPHP